MHYVKTSGPLQPGDTVFSITLHENLNLDIEPYHLNLIALSPCANFLYIAVGSTIQVYKLLDDNHPFTLISQIPSSETSPTSINYIHRHYSPNNSLLCSVHNSGSALIHCLNSSSIISLETGESAWGCSIDDSTIPLVAVSNNSKNVTIFDLHHETLPSTLSSFHNHNIPSIYFQFPFLATSSIDGHVRLFNTTTNELIFSHSPSDQWGWSVELIEFKYFIRNKLPVLAPNQSPSSSDSSLQRPSLAHSINVRRFLQQLGSLEVEYEDVGEITLRLFEELQREEGFYSEEEEEDDVIDDVAVKFSGESFRNIILYGTKTSLFCYNLMLNPSSPFKIFKNLIPKIIPGAYAINRLSLIETLHLLGIVLVASQGSFLIAVLRFGENLDGKFDLLHEGFIDFSNIVPNFLESPIAGISSSFITNSHPCLYRVSVLFLNGVVIVFDLSLFSKFDK
ncbi:hypothetical protein RCL1_005947 [Eukaryota sp. TZLM3-RCL]